MPALPDYVVIDRTYREMKSNANPVEAPVVKSTTEAPVDKKALRLANLQEAYEMIRAKPMTCATIVRLNYVEPPAPI